MGQDRECYGAQENRSHTSLPTSKLLWRSDLESRIKDPPITNKWRYLFFIDINTHL